MNIKPRSFILTAALILQSSTPTLAALLYNGSLNDSSSISRYSFITLGDEGDTDYSFPSAAGVVAVNTRNGSGPSSIGLANQWITTLVDRGFLYSPTGGADLGGAFVHNSEEAPFNGRSRSVLQFASDNRDTTGWIDVSLDVFFNEASSVDTDLLFNVELFAWNAGQIGPSLSVGGDFTSYNTSILGDATTLIENVEILASSVPSSTWLNIDVAESLDLNDGYDFYAWRIGVRGAASGDIFSFDNVEVTQVPEASVSLLLASVTLLLAHRRDRRN